MIDVSQANALPLPDTIRRILRMQAAMGLNCLMLYLEDTYEVEGEPYFGYMRPRYTREELKALDDYAYALGVEIIPCIQTLAHLTDALRWNAFRGVRDDESTLLVGEEKTYELLERMIRSAASPFRSRRIHIGSDEAWHLGLGEYLRRNGYESKHSVLSRHLPRVTQIVRGLGLRPMMWGDMFFRALLPDGEYYTDGPLDFPPELLRSIPEDMDIIYWDYYSEAPVMRNMFALNRKLERPLLFAGCIRNNRSFGYSHAKTVQNTDLGLGLGKANGVREVFATIWGDNCPESCLMGILLGMQLYAEHGYAAEVPQADWYARFAFCCHGEAEAFAALKYMDEIPEALGENGNCLRTPVNPSRWLLWQDPLLGLLDANVPAGAGAHYARLAENMARYGRESPAHAEMFAFYATACQALALKAELGVKLHAAYCAGDREALASLADSAAGPVRGAVTRLRDAHFALWMHTNKPLGWETLDIRYGALLRRLETVRERVQAYLSGKAQALPELEEPRLPYNGREGLVAAYLYKDIVSAGRI